MEQVLRTKGRLAGSCSFIKLDKMEFKSVTLGLTWHDARNKSFLKVRPRTSRSSRPYLNAARTWAYTLRSFKYSGSTSTTPSARTAELIYELFTIKPLDHFTGVVIPKNSPHVILAEGIIRVEHTLNTCMLKKSQNYVNSRLLPQENL